MTNRDDYEAHKYDSVLRDLNEVKRRNITLQNTINGLHDRLDEKEREIKALGDKIMDQKIKMNEWSKGIADRVSKLEHSK